jgi:hypothetical protein
MSIESNVAASKAAEAKRRNTAQAVMLILETAIGFLDDVEPQMFWIGIAVAALDHAGVLREEPPAPPKPHYPPMTDDEARKFGYQLNKCRPHVGTQFKDCPHDFLTWLDSVRFQEAVELHRYVESDSFQREVQDDECE